MNYSSYLHSAENVLQQYRGEQPFPGFLKDFFRADKKYGSRDRKWIAQLCYCYFRMGKAGRDMPTKERLLASFFCCSTAPNPLLEQMKPEWNEKVSMPIQDKWKMVMYDIPIESVFPWRERCSEGLDIGPFVSSLFTQPDLFLRTRPGKEATVIKKLQTAGIPYTVPQPGTLALPNGSKLDDLVDMDREAVIQDMNSQRTGELFSFLPAKEKLIVWDCCAASGGKSIMAHDLLPGIRLTATDVRESILVNLRKRFEAAGVKEYSSKVLDLSTQPFPSKAFQPQLIIADVPCSGSGTWGRTPEQLYFFDEEKINHYAALQRKIISNVVTSLAPGNHLLYITCSVFADENEKNVAQLASSHEMEIVQSNLFTGYEKRADTLFAAMLRKL